MALDTSALRTPDQNFPQIKDRVVRLIRIGGGSVSQANSVTDKREMLRSLKKSHTLIAVWTGQWTSDAFQFPDELLANWKEILLT